MIKNLQKISFLLATGLVLGSSTTIAQTLYEPFVGVGLMNGYNGWANHSGTADQMNRVAGSLTYTGLATSTDDKLALLATDAEDVNKLLAAPVTAGVIYGSTLVKVLDATTLLANNTDGNYFMHFQTGVGTTPFVARVYLREGSAANTFNIGVLNNSGGTVTAVEMYGANPTDYVVGETYLVVFKYELATNTSSLWVNPALGGAEPAALVSNSGGAANPSITGLAIRQSNKDGKGTGTIEIDEVRTGSTFAEVTPGSTTGLKDFASAGLQLYPNPTTGAINLQLPTSFSAKSQIGLTLYAVNGDVLLKVKGSAVVLNEQLSTKLESAAAGMYILKIDNGSESYQSRIVKN